ncbi:hypothetical protein FRB96_001898 [Tulasnella sp. 330]|nr:hypothetical protein FRB96_001898 [Tulasnella sp. 330]
MSVGDMRAALSQFSSSAMPMRMVQDRRPSTDLLPNLTAMALRPSMEGHYASPVATVRGSYISATTSPYALARTITGSNNSTTNSAPKPKVVRRTKSSGSPLLCGMFSTGAELSNFSDLQPDVKACGAGAGAGGSGTSVKIAISVVQEEWKSGEGRQSGGSVKRKSRFSMIKSRMRSGSDAAKIGVAV